MVKYTSILTHIGYHLLINTHVLKSLADHWENVTTCPYNVDLKVKVRSVVSINYFLYTEPWSNNRNILFGHNYWIQPNFESIKKHTCQGQNMFFPYLVLVSRVLNEEITVYFYIKKQENVVNKWQLWGITFQTTMHMICKPMFRYKEHSWGEVRLQNSIYLSMLLFSAVSRAI